MDLVDAYNNLRNDPNYHKNFTLIYRTAKFRNLQVRMLPVYRKAVAEMLARIERITIVIPNFCCSAGDLLCFDTANEYYWHPKPVYY